MRYINLRLLTYLLLQVLNACRYRATRFHVSATAFLHAVADVFEQTNIYCLSER